MSNEEHSVNFYNKVHETYHSSDYFDEIILEIKYINNIQNSNSNDRAYKITDISITERSSVPIDFKEFIDVCNSNLKKSSISQNWQIFYLYKEIFQFFVSSSQGYNFFRGQAHDYPLLPGILRSNVQNNYRNNFESLYLKISNEFPDKLQYFELNDSCNIEEREYQLSLLQHYGLKTSLLDITSNPYIAMLFMLSEQGIEYKEPTLSLFKIDEGTHRQKHLFTEVRKSKLNERIIAQKGAFLNFDKIFANKAFDIEKIPCIKIILKFDDTAYVEYIEQELEKLESLKSLGINSPESDDYKNLLEFQKCSIKEVRKECLNFIKNELSNKLKEYYYFESDLFPDFEKRIQYLSEKYEANGVKKMSH